MRRSKVFIFAAALLGIVGCNSSMGSTPAPTPSGSPPQQPIAHIVILIQENRSFDNLFAGFPGADTTLQGPCKPAPRCTGTHTSNCNR